ncbi:MAG: hypothetical protein WCJ86_00165 [Candidatus Saccharibacteria bacterium]
MESITDSQEKPLDEALAEPMNPIDNAEWLAVHSISEKDYEPGGNEILGYLVVNGNERASSELHERLDHGQSNAARVLALVSGDPKYLDAQLQAVKGNILNADSMGSYGRKYRDPAEKVALNSIDKLCDTARKIGAEGYLMELLEGIDDEKISKDALIEHMQTRFSEERPEADLDTPMFVVQVGEEDEQTIDALVSETLTGTEDIETILSSVEALEDKMARVVAYNRIAQALKLKEQGSHLDKEDIAGITPSVIK